MKTGAIFTGTDNDDLIEFMRFIRERGGEVICRDYNKKILEVIRGTKQSEKIELFNIDGVLGSVNVDADPGEDAEQA